MNRLYVFAGFSMAANGHAYFCATMALFFATVPLVAQNAQPPAQAAYAQQTPSNCSNWWRPLHCTRTLLWTGAGGIHISRAGS